MKRILTAFLVVLMVVSMVAVAIPAAALTVASPTNENTPTLSVVSSNPNAGTVIKEELGDNTFRLTAKPSPGYAFEKWESEAGEYTILEGDLNSSVIVIKMSADTRIIAKFSNASSGKPGSTSTTSPDTGDYSGLIVLATMITLAGAAYVCKKIFA